MIAGQRLPYSIVTLIFPLPEKDNCSGISEDTDTRANDKRKYDFLDHQIFPFSLSHWI